MTESFLRDMMKISIAQICNELNFSGIQENALELLLDLLQQYIEEIGYRTHLITEQSCRTESNYGDVACALKTLNLSMTDLYKFFSTLAEDSEFPREIPEIPVKSISSSKSKTLASSSSNAEPKKDQTEANAESGEGFPPYIPSFLPPFPPSHTFKKTEINIQRVSDPRELLKVKGKEKRQKETELSKLSEKLNEVTPPTEPNFVVDKTRNTTSTSVNPTPVEKNSSYYTNKRSYDTFEEKRPYVDTDETERQKKKHRAMQILSSDLGKETEIHEDPNKN